MKKIVFFVGVCFFVQFALSVANAQDTAVYEGLTYYLKKKEAFDAARSQDKQVLLFWGTNTCSRCNLVKKHLASESIASVLEEHYILWFCDATVYLKTSPEVSDYLSQLTNVPYPAICVIDTSDITVGYGLMTGDQNTVSALLAMLNRYVDNERIAGVGDHPAYAYVSGERLVVRGSVENEIICVYTLTGSLIDRFSGNDDSSTRNASVYPKGILCVSSSSGWTTKVAVR